MYNSSPDLHVDVLQVSVITALIKFRDVDFLPLTFQVLSLLYKQDSSMLLKDFPPCPEVRKFHGEVWVEGVTRCCVAFLPRYSPQNSEETLPHEVIVDGFNNFCRARAAGNPRMTPNGLVASG